MLYLKYRPRTIAELDNRHAKEDLTHILSSHNLPHAFLFVGRKGTGKTSSARIVAKAVNCLSNSFAGKGTSIEPCNTCVNCRAVDSDSSADVTEMDAASNRGIEEVRTLIKNASFAPLMSRYRVYIIDEAHMITNDAFNALLKTLEEPPSSVIFILATTNEEKIPATIASRCYKVVFGTAHNDDLRDMLKRVVHGENITISDEVIDLIIRSADRSFRDAVRLLEELVMQKKLDIAGATQYLRVRSPDGLITLIEDKKPIKELLTWTKEYDDAGGSFKYVMEELLTTLREMLFTIHGIPTEEGRTTTLTAQEVTRLMKHIQSGYDLLRMSPIQSIPLEIALVDFYNEQTVTK